MDNPVMAHLVRRKVTRRVRLIGMGGGAVGALVTFAAVGLIFPAVGGSQEVEHHECVGQRAPDRRRARDLSAHLHADPPPAHRGRAPLAGRGPAARRSREPPHVGAGSVLGEARCARMVAGRGRVRGVQRTGLLVGPGGRGRGHDLVRWRDDVRARLPALRARRAVGGRARAGCSTDGRDGGARCAAAAVDGVGAGDGSAADRCDRPGTSSAAGWTHNYPYVGKAVLFLGIVATCTGFLATVLAARAIADPLTAVRRGVDRIGRGEFDRARACGRRQRGGASCRRRASTGWPMGCGSANGSATCSAGRWGTTWPAPPCPRASGSGVRSGRSPRCSSTSLDRPRWPWRSPRPRSCAS